MEESLPSFQPYFVDEEIGGAVGGGLQLASLVFSAFWAWQPPPWVAPEQTRSTSTAMKPAPLPVASRPLGWQVVLGWVLGLHLTSFHVAARLHLSSLSAGGSSSGLGFSGAGIGRNEAGFASQFGSSQSWHGSGEPRGWGVPWLGSFIAATPPSLLLSCHGVECRESWNV